MSTVPGPALVPAPNPLVRMTGDQLAELVAQIATRTEQRPPVQQPSYFEGERTKFRIFVVQPGIYFEALGWNEDQHHKKITYPNPSEGEPPANGWFPTSNRDSRKTGIHGGNSWKPSSYTSETWMPRKRRETR